MISRLANALALLSPLLAQEPAPPATGSVSGQVVDALAEPVLLADVWVTAGLDGEVMAREKTDGSGTFVIGRLPRRPNLVVRATAAGLSEAFAYVTPNPTVTLANTAWLRLWDAGTISGRVVDASGAPITGAEVIANYDDARMFNWGDGCRSTTDADGRYTLLGVPLGMIDVRAFAPGYVLGSARVPLHEHSHKDLALQKGDGVRITVRAVGLEAKELRDARVSLLAYGEAGVLCLPRQLRHGRLDANGVCIFAGLPDSHYSVMVEDGRLVFDPSSQDSRPGEVRDLSFKALRPETTKLRGVLLDPAGEPLSNEVLVLSAANGAGRSARGVTAEDGKFEVESTVAVGERFIARLSGSKWVLSREGVVDLRTVLELRAEPEARLRGHVLDRDGQPVPFVEVDVERARVGSPERWAFAMSSASDREGRFVVRGLAASDDPVRLRVAGHAGAVETKPFRLEAGREVGDMELRLTPPAIVGGTVLDRDGAPLAGARVWLCVNEKYGAVSEVLTDRQGRYRHTGVAPGAYYLEVRLDGHEVASRADPFEVEPGQRVQHDL